MEIKFKDHSVDMVKTVDRASLMANSFKESALRTKNDIEDIFGSDDSSYEQPADVMTRGMIDSAGYAFRVGDELIHRYTAENGADMPRNDEYIHQIQFEAGREKAIADEYMRKESVENIQRNRLAESKSDEYFHRQSSRKKNKGSTEERIVENIQRNDAAKDGIRLNSSKNVENIHRRGREYAIKRLGENRDKGLVRILPGSGKTSGNGKGIADRAGRILKQLIDDAKAIFTSYTAAGAIAILIVTVTIFFGAGFAMIGDENGDNFAIDLYEIGPGDTAIVKVAQAQVGNVGGDKYWKWYGFKSHVHWCAIWVSWCGNQCGYLKAGIIPKFAIVGNGANWFKERHRWASGGYSPKPGDVIFFDFERDGTLDHVGLVESCDGKTVNTIEGNSGNACRRQTYRRGAASIAGYGIPAYNEAPKKDDKDKLTE